MSGASASQAVVSAGNASAEAKVPGEARVPFRDRVRQALPWLIVLVSIGLPITWSGLWAPYELDVAQLSRRIAVGLHSADLGGPEAPPSLSELGKGQLPFSLIAVGFQVFGLHDWAGRLPLAFVGILGALALYTLVKGLADAKAAGLAAAALATMPLYFLHARTLLGDGVGMVAAATSTAGLALTCFGGIRRPPSVRVLAMALALLGLLAGFASAGALLGLASPLLSVGMAWAILRLAGLRRSQSQSSALGGMCLVLGSLAAAASLWLVVSPSEEGYLRYFATALDAQTKLRTHDAMLHQLGHGLLPWSAFAPFAVAIALRPPVSASESNRALRLVLVCSIVVALAAHAMLDTSTSPSAFVGTFAVAGLCGVALRDMEQGAVRTRLVAAGTLALLLLLVLDVKEHPEQGLYPFLVGSVSVPDSFVEWGGRVVLVAGAVGLTGLGIALSDLLPLQWKAWLRERTGSTMADAAAIALVLSGLGLSLVYYPGLARALSPRDAFRAVSQLAGKDQPLAVLGKASGVAPYYAARSVHVPRSAPDALSWLLNEGKVERRWLIFERRHLAQLNSLFRKHSTPSTNLPVIDAQSSEVMLASNRLDGDANQNPLDAWVSSDPPKPQHPLDVGLQEQLTCLGWSLLDQHGRPVDEARAGEDYTMEIYWRVESSISKTWKTFVHIDVPGKRYNGDHDTLGGEYAFRYWRTGDYITDSHTVRFNRTFAGSTSRVYFGLFSGNDRLLVTRGKHHENRIDGGQLVIR